MGWKKPILSEEMAPLVVIVDGIIGAAKTTYIGMLVERLEAEGWKIAVIREPVERWVESGILKRYYEDQARWAYHFQTVTFMDRIMESRSIYEENQAADLILMERSPMTDRVFMDLLYEDGKVDQLEMDNYQRWCSLWNMLMPFVPDYSIYLRPSLEVCMMRLQKRAREGENLIPTEYQRKLMEKHDQLLQGPTVRISPTLSIPTTQISTDREFIDDPAIQAEMIAQFKAIIHQS